MPTRNPETLYSIDYKRFVQDFFRVCEAAHGNRGAFTLLKDLGIPTHYTSRVLSDELPSFPAAAFLVMALHADLDPTAYIIYHEET